LNIFHSLYAVEKVMEEYEDWSSKDHATYGTVSHHKANTSRGQPVYKI